MPMPITEDEGMKRTPNASCWAHLKYPDGLVEQVPLSQLEGFKPQHKNDTKRKYTVLSNKWNVDKKFKRYKTLIVRIEESIPPIEKSLRERRASYPPLHPSESDILPTDSEGERHKKPSNRKDPSMIASKKKQAAEADFGDFIRSAPLSLRKYYLNTLKKQIVNQSDCSSSGQPNKKGSGTEASTSSRKENRNSSPMTILSPLNTSGEPKNVVLSSNAGGHGKTIQKMLNEKDEEIKFLKQKVDQWKKIESQEGQEVMDELRSLNCRLKRIEDILIADKHEPKRPASVVTLHTTGLPYSIGAASENVSTLHLDIEDDMVNLGHGVKCTVTAWSTMSTTNNVKDWCGALLAGVFGKEARLYRANIREKLANSANLRIFPEKFKAVALALYQDFLRRTRPEVVVTQRILKPILSMLSQKARDMNGRRNKHIPPKHIDAVVDQLPNQEVVMEEIPVISAMVERSP